ncbi:hypothetical protein ZOSMA_42G01170 [Zostera marina]|uniref:Kinesin motor domain-containing protein n=1 Tax=Zostera marina TaxID=29655 RepID=A0A0K9P265_ZOSMR|nr:hypothetical protein ZOSMA_42G01170 [Zostera marina]
MDKYNQEHIERKLLYNEIMEMKGNVRVFCRCRPLSSEEVSKGHTCSFHFDPSKNRKLQIIASDASRKQFKFDHVFPPQANQETVFAETLLIVRSVLDGYNACIFAYGQTGTGKTFTIEGTEETRGVYYRTLEDLFKISTNRSSTMQYQFYVSMLEVYNENIRDLLNSKLDIKQTSEGKQEILGLTLAQAYNTDEVWELLETGKRNRSVGSTSVNELSSRSHCLLRVTVMRENLINGTQTKSHLWLVDLAGSKRIGKTEAKGERLKESQFINRSLSALGDVIAAFASKNQHIPYQN